MQALDRTPDTYLPRDTAVQTLASALRDGCLMLFVGAGVSKSATGAFPDWSCLVERCCKAKNVSFDPAHAESTLYLRKRMDEVKRQCTPQQFISMVEKELYRDVKYDVQLMKTDLLVSLGSLVMNSLRGAARAVVTYNFDDLLEWYLAYHGYRIDIVSQFPCIMVDSDVRVYHPHGLLPMSQKFARFRTDEIVLTEQDYEDTIAAQVNPWNEVQRSLLGCSVGLFIGLSGDDPHIKSLCGYVYRQIIRKKRIIGFQVFRDTPQAREDEGDNLDHGIVNQYISNYSDLPGLLLEICRTAAAI